MMHRVIVVMLLSFGGRRSPSGSNPSALGIVHSNWTCSLALVCPLSSHLRSGGKQTNHPTHRKQRLFFESRNADRKFLKHCSPDATLPWAPDAALIPSSPLPPGCFFKGCLLHLQTIRGPAFGKQERRHPFKRLDTSFALALESEVTFDVPEILWIFNSTACRRQGGEWHLRHFYWTVFTEGPQPTH